jgi:S-adenosylmethionine synthetase
LDVLKSEIIAEVLHPVFTKFPFDADTEILVNPSGRFVEGGPRADTGLTGRKLMVDTYGGLGAHGGGAFSGKDPTKVDRSGAYMARCIAKNIVSADLADECQVAISYAIGKADPVAVQIDTFGTGKVSDEMIAKAANDVFNMRPAAIINEFCLRNCSFAEYSAYGHFGNGYPTWEHTDKYRELREAVKRYEDND